MKFDEYVIGLCLSHVELIIKRIIRKKKTKKGYIMVRLPPNMENENILLINIDRFLVITLTSVI